MFFPKDVHAFGEGGFSTKGKKRGGHSLYYVCPFACTLVIANGFILF